MSREWRPQCMTVREEWEWRNAAAFAFATHGVQIPSICADCAPAFQRENQQAGTCNSVGRNMASHIKRARIEAMRAEGLSWAQIGLRLDISARQAQDAFRPPRGKAA